MKYKESSERGKIYNYEKALGEKSEEAWVEYKKAKKVAKQVVKKEKGGRLGKVWKAAAAKLSGK